MIQGPVSNAFCWAHARRAFYKLANVGGIAIKRPQGMTDAIITPLAFEAVKRINAIFDIEWQINGKTADERLAASQEVDRR